MSFLAQAIGGLALQDQTVGLAPDLAPAERLLGHLYGEPTPWDSEEAQQAAESRFLAGAKDLEAAGAGRTLKVDCGSYPCLAIVETDVEDAIPETMTALKEHLEGLSVWSFFDVEVEGGEARRFVLEQEIEDISPWDPYLQMRKSSLMIEASTPQRLRPTEEDAQVPITWPAMAN